MLAEILKTREKAIAEHWVELVMKSYPAESSGFLLRERDPFANPIGHLVREASIPLVSALREENPGPEALDYLDRLMRLRSVQDWTAGQAVAIVPLLRPAVLDLVRDSIDQDALLELVARVERLSLAAFDVFTGCRRQLFEVRLHERDRHQASLLRRAERVLAGEGKQEAELNDSGRSIPVGSANCSTQVEGG